MLLVIMKKNVVKKQHVDKSRIYRRTNMTISQIMHKMIVYSEGNIHDIDHLIRVWTYAKTIGELERVDKETQFILEAAAIFCL